MANRRTTHQDRIKMIELKQTGYTLAQIAEHMGLHRDTVRTWWRRYRDAGWEALQPSQKPNAKPGPMSQFDSLVRYVALRLKRQHPGWGAPVLLATMARRPSLAGKRLPSRSTLSAYLKPYGRRIRPAYHQAMKRPCQPAMTIRAPHECWQIDFKGDESVGTAGHVSPLMIVDRLTSAPLGTVLFPAGLKGVTSRDVQRELRVAFATWGLPDMLQMDRGSIFVGSTRLEWPGVLLLWLAGLGIQPIINPAGRPTYNAQVERQNRTWQEQVALGADYPTMATAQEVTDAARYDRLFVLPSRNRVCQGQPPVQACPALSVPRRRFIPEQEALLFDIERVELYLSDWRWRRMVDQDGKIYLADHRFSVGRDYARQTLDITYDLTAREFVACTFADPPVVVRQFSLPIITPHYIMGT